MIKVEDKSCLKLGDIIYFHSWGVEVFFLALLQILMKMKYFLIN